MIINRDKPEGHKVSVTSAKFAAKRLVKMLAKMLIKMPTKMTATTHTIRSQKCPKKSDLLVLIF